MQMLNLGCCIKGMVSGCHISIYLDTRRAKASGKYPVKLRVYTSEPRKQKLYPTQFEFSKTEFQSIWETIKPREKYKTAKKKIQAVLNKAEKAADDLDNFTFELFEIALYKKQSDKRNAYYYFDKIRDEKLRLGSISTAEKYMSAKISLQKFERFRSTNKEDWTRTNPTYNDESILDLALINPEYLSAYERYWLGRNHSKATIGINLRNLRTVYRKAIREKEVSIDQYPFGLEEDGKYEIPTSSRVNKALSQEEVEILWNANPLNEDQAKAKAFWFFSYFAYGMNTKDVCQLKHSSIRDGRIYYVRAKTKSTKKKETEKQVPITKNIEEIIRNFKDCNSTYLFGVLDEKDNPKQEHDKIKKFNHFINKHFREFAQSTEVDSQMAKEIGTYHARHSFATIAVRKGYALELISDILHDGNIITTQNYLDSFPKQAFDDLSSSMEL